MTRRTRTGIRHDDGPIPDEMARRVRHGRERLSRHLSWLAIGLVILSFGAGLIL